MEATDENYGARLEYLRNIESFVRSIFDAVQEIEETNRIAEALDQEYEERIKNGTENDPDFQARWNADDGTRGHSVVAVLYRTLENGCDSGDSQLVMASSYEAAVEMMSNFRIDVQRTICTDYESAMRVVRDQMDLGAQFTLSPAAASA